MKEQLQHIFQNGYPGSNVFIEKILKPIFSEDVITNIDIDIIDSPEKRRRADNANILSAIHITDIDRVDSDPIALYDVTLSPGSNITHSRVAIKQFIASEVMTFTHAFILFHYDNEPERPWRFSYVYKERTTSATRAVAKRFTYVFGKDYRSRTAVERFIDLAHSPKADIDFAKAFSVETLSDEFFDRYRELYADFVQYITGKRYVKESGKWLEKKIHNANPQLATSFDGDDKLVRDYIKKMFGRIVFLYFLQRKGWLAGNRQYMHDLFYSSEVQDNFLDGVLEPLFFGVLNTRPEHRSADVAALPDYDKIPYLNGGLFQQDEIDERTCVLPTDYFKRLFDFFDQYNFTIDENDPEDAEVGIDPEMLGRIFENLLEDNKDKGAFYTPKEIVEYICRESIIAYLLNGIPERSHELIRNFVETLDADSLNNEQRKYLVKKLVDVKICDPAIGSGAFPMGIVNILSKIYLALGLVRDRSKMKRHIMEQNIYGVDIEKGAVDIARLRFWLAMVVDATEPEPLPNLHFKIMQGNSLLESYRGKDLSRLTEVNIGESGSLGLQSEDAKSLISSLGRYYNESDHSERKKILEDIIKNVQRQIYELTQSEEFMSDVKDISANDKFFLWHTWFADVFANGGFDIVIGNPPYNELRDLDEESQLNNKTSKYFKYAKGGRVNMFQFFYPLAIDILKVNGICSLITQNSLLAENSALKNRKLIFDTTKIIKIDSFPERDDVNKRVFKSAKMSVCICTLRKVSDCESHIDSYCLPVRIWKDKYMENGSFLYIDKDEIDNIYPEDRIIPICDNKRWNLLVKIKNQGSFSINAQAGEIDMTKYRNLFSSDSSLQRVLTGAQVQRYYVTDNPSQGQIFYLDLSSMELSPDRMTAISNPRIVMQRITGVDSKIRLICTLIPKGYLCANSTNYISSAKNNFDLYELLGLLNSKLFNFYIKQTSTNTNVTGKEIAGFPVKHIIQMRDTFINLVKKRLSTNEALVEKDLENRIDHIVYHLYLLTYDEVLIIDPQTPISRAEYESLNVDAYGQS